MDNGAGWLVGPPGDLCRGCRSSSRCRLGVQALRLLDGGSALAHVTFDETHEGGPGVAHGGVTAGMFDEVLGQAVSAFRDMTTVTRDLTVRYRRPVPLHHPLLVNVRAEPHGEGRWLMHGTLVLASSRAELCTASGVWVERHGGEHFGRYQRWLAEQSASPGGDRPIC